MTTMRFFMIAAMALALAGTAHAGPGSLPNYLVKKFPPDRARPAYALTGKTRASEDGFRARTVSIGGARDQRTVFEREAR